MNSPAFPDGHFYSPIVDIKSAKDSEQRIWPEYPEVLGINFNENLHKKYLEYYFPKYISLYDYPDELSPNDPPFCFFTNNSQFSWLDSRTHFVMMHTKKPKKIIEIGSGFSSLLSADINRRFFLNDMDIICIEPYPRDFLKSGIPGLTQLIQEKVEDVPLSVYDSLECGDVLFIDSSHVSKTGSDVNHIYFEILPRLKRGVIIHIHDIFLPFDYKKEWVLEEKRSWNEHIC